MITRKFPYSNYDVTIVDKEDILRTIDDNIIDKDIALDLVSSLEVKAFDYLKQERWTAFPFLGNIRVPKGLSKEVQDSYKDIRQYAYNTMDRKSYVAFIREIALDNKAIINYNKYFNQALAMAVRKNKSKWNSLCRKYGVNYASCKMVFGFKPRLVRENYEYINEDLENGFEDRC